MKDFLTKKQRVDIKTQLSEMKAQIHYIEKSNTINDDRILELYSELKKRVEFAYIFIRTARIFTEFEQGNKDFIED